mmetsp:Transcript_35168/g.38085  ORF Transcript_35168/g.38085 Transcript_35168/m.38085 type:complete len:83 (-) Transcript_35168:447-695(-)
MLLSPTHIVLVLRFIKHIVKELFLSISICFSSQAKPSQPTHTHTNKFLSRSLKRKRWHKKLFWYRPNLFFHPTFQGATLQHF